MKKLLSLFMAIMMVFTLSGCSKPTAEDYYSKPENATMLREAEQSVKAQNGFNDVKIEVKGNDVRFIFVLPIDVPESLVATMQSQLDASFGPEAMSGFIGPIEEECGVKGLSLTIIVKNANGTQIYEKTGKN